MSYARSRTQEFYNLNNILNAPVNRIKINNDYLSPIKLSKQQYSSRNICKIFNNISNKPQILYEDEIIDKAEHSTCSDKQLKLHKAIKKEKQKGERSSLSEVSIENIDEKIEDMSLDCNDLSLDENLVNSVNSIKIVSEEFNLKDNSPRLNVKRRSSSIFNKLQEYFLKNNQDKFKE